ncbi:RHTO0S34e00320g1_1 [Rhodotorula toruloides]|uniref:RHTO0S34e00320g1_1 n=2 Tax=Rhodotorula toruloides TaxID=5286 RepID=A0A061BIJ7_RHOTO|nr:reverse transcriptase [Rhodotorula toruloides NP11]EMS18097.1 reverse transcriptase [Rhodotorula toruloides NP11]CDR49809.1 RHTO0S34e00320g1_1 [Rhodotorula toruloides]
MATNWAKAVIRREKRRAERAEVEEVDEASLWKVVKSRLGEGGSAASSTLPLKKDDGTYATSPIDKLALLQPVLLLVVKLRFVEAQSADKGNGRTVSGLQVGREFIVPPATSPADDCHAIRLASPQSPPRPASCRLAPPWSSPDNLGDATGIVLKKPKKEDYSLTKSYRLICFERCVSKLLESIVARRITHLADSLKLVPPTHFGARPGRFAEDAVVCFVDEIKRQWRNGNVVLGIALDVAKAYPSVRTDVLVRDMEEKGLPRSLLR